MEYIRNFEYRGLWGSKQVLWHNINEDVNILVGINGAGKTTLLNLIYEYYTKYQASSHKISVSSVYHATETLIPVAFIRSFDVPSNAKKNTNSPLYETLSKVVYQNNERKSFFDYRMRALNYKDQAPRVERSIEELFYIINDFFAETKKKIEFDLDNNKLVFRTKDGDLLSLDKLSAGEKQLMLILLTVFLMDEEQYVLLMDEPELSLHIEWQSKLIKALRKLNKNCQLIITTHSPSIFASGWQNKLVYMDEIVEE